MWEFRQTSTVASPAGTAFEVEVIDERSGICVLEIRGKNAKKIFQNESGGHRWQGISPTDKAGRIHTSTITVAVLDPLRASTVQLLDKDLTITVCRGSGAGGQNRNKRDTAVQVRHKPSGLSVRCESNRTQGQNKEAALLLLQMRLLQAKEGAESARRSANKKLQVGCGARGDKRRTIREQHGEVVDHLTGQSWSYDKYVKGIW